jgi:hypothetical protein
VAEEEADVDGGGGIRQSAASTDRVQSSGDLESGRDVESFGMKSEMTQAGLLFIDSKITAAVLV